MVGLTESREGQVGERHKAGRGQVWMRLGRLICSLGSRGPPKRFKQGCAPEVILTVMWRMERNKEWAAMRL